MNENSEIDWGYIVSIGEFQSYLGFDFLKEISIISKLARDKLNPVLFKKLKLNLNRLKFDSNVISVAYNNYTRLDYDYNSLREESNCNIEESVNDFIIEINSIKKYTNSFYFDFNRNAGYYLYPLIICFINLTDLKIEYCDIPYRAFADIGKKLSNLNSLELESLNLVKSTREVISESDITFPPNLSYLKISNFWVITTNLTSDPLEFLLDRKRVDYSESFTLPKISIPSLKRLDFIPKGDVNREIDEFLEANPNVESLLTRYYDLNIDSSLISVKHLDIDENYNFNNINQTFRLSTINSLAFSTRDFNYSENIRKLCQICPNITILSLRFLGKMPKFQPVISNYLPPILSNLHSLKTLVILNADIGWSSQFLDFNNLRQIEKLKIELKWGSLLNIKFDKSKSLKKVELTTYDEYFTDTFKRTFGKYYNWKFKFNGHTVKGFKI